MLLICQPSFKPVFDLASCGTHYCTTDQCEMPHPVGRACNSRIASPAPLRFGETHFGVFAGENDSGRSGTEGRQHGFFHALRRTLAVIDFGRDVNINACPDLGFCAGNSL